MLRHGAVAEEMLAADATIAKVVSAMIGGSEVVADAAV